MADRMHDGTQVAGVDAARDQYAETIRRMYRATTRAHKGIVPMSGEAAHLFRSWTQERRAMAQTFGSLSSALESHIAKHPAMALRVALTFHIAKIVQHADDQARDPAAFPLMEATMKEALAFMRRAAQHALALFVGPTGGSEAYDLARDVARFLLATDAREIARRDLQGKVRTFRAADQRRQGDALSLLVDLDWLRPQEGGYHKAVPARYLVNPLAAKSFESLAEQERQRRAALRELIAESASDRRTA